MAKNFARENITKKYAVKFTSIIFQDYISEF